MTTSDPAAIAAILRDARHIVALTGAGISAESGLPTFRDAQSGLWAKYRPEELATPEAFARDPRLVWDWYAWRRTLVERAHPNPGHFALARMQRLAPKFTLVTQNVDGLHRRAGSTHIHELHGDLMSTICSRERVTITAWPETDEAPPPCPRCGAPLRPAVVWFGEPLPADALFAASAAAGRCDALLVIGTSLHVYPAASLVPIALDAGAHVVIVNTESPTLTPHERLHLILGSAAATLPRLLELAWPEAARDEPAS
jgi:NAD-dependent deacetylase